MRRGPIAVLPFLWIALLVQILAPASAALSMAHALQTGAAGAPICGQRFLPPGGRPASASVLPRMSSADKSETPYTPLAPVDCCSLCYFVHAAGAPPAAQPDHVVLRAATTRRASWSERSDLIIGGGWRDHPPARAPPFGI